MKPFVVYESATGKILRSGVCRNEDVVAQAGLGEAAMEGSGSDLFHEVDLDSGRIVARPEPLPPPKPIAQREPPSDEEIDAAQTVDDLKLLLKRAIRSR